MAFAKRVGKVGVVSGVCFSFIGNRMFAQYLRGEPAAARARPQQVDNAMQHSVSSSDWCAVSDLAGLDVGYKGAGE
jgi:3-hydroxyacyl-CoA dehydrogenase